MFLYFCWKYFVSFSGYDILYFTGIINVFNEKILTKRRRIKISHLNRHRNHKFHSNSPKLFCTHVKYFYQFYITRANMHFSTCRYVAARQQQGPRDSTSPRGRTLAAWSWTVCWASASAGPPPRQEWRTRVASTSRTRRHRRHRRTTGTARRLDDPWPAARTARASCARLCNSSIPSRMPPRGEENNLFFGGGERLL